jgi:hypothetical protein
MLDFIAKFIVTDQDSAHISRVELLQTLPNARVG